MKGAIGANTSRPVGITVLAAVVGAFGIVTALLGLWDVLRGFVLGIMESPHEGGRALAGGIFSVVLGGVYMLAAYGLWYLRPWAWWLAAAVSVAGIVVSFGAILWMVAWAAVLVYLVLVRQSFGDLGSPSRPLRA